MPTVYTHMKSFPVRTINFFQQRSYELGRVGQISSEIDELTRQRDFFKEFLLTYGPLVGTVSVFTPEQVTYIRGLAAVVGVRLTDALIEKDLVIGILARLQPCAGCNGKGELFHPTPMYGSDDYPSREPCKACDGEGVAKEQVVQ